MFLNRRNIFTGLLAALGVARAQQTAQIQAPDLEIKSIETGSLGNHKLNNFLWKGDKPINNWCPVCGTMAESYIRLQTNCCGTDAELANHTSTISCYPEWPQCDIAKSRITRCKRCNAAFFQDAEEPKK